MMWEIVLQNTVTWIYRGKIIQHWNILKRPQTSQAAIPVSHTVLFAVSRISLMHFVVKCWHRWCLRCFVIGAFLPISYDHNSADSPTAITHVNTAEDPLQIPYSNPIGPSWIEMCPLGEGNQLYTLHLATADAGLAFLFKLLYLYV